MPCGRRPTRPASFLRTATGSPEATGETQPEICPMLTKDAGQILTLQRLCYRGEAELYDDYTIPPLTQTLE